MDENEQEQNINSPQEINDRIDDAVDRIERLVKAGHTDAARTIRWVIELGASLREYTTMDMAGNGLIAIECLLDAFELVGVRPVIPTDEFTRRARVLCADLLELGKESNTDHWNQEQVGQCRDEARALLTGEK